MKLKFTINFEVEQYKEEVEKVKQMSDDELSEVLSRMKRDAEEMVRGETDHKTLKNLVVTVSLEGEEK